MAALCGSKAGENDVERCEAGQSVAGPPHIIGRRSCSCVRGTDRLFGAQAFPFRAATQGIDFSEFPICNMIKLTVTNNAVAVVENALSLTSNHSLTRANPLERHYRDVRCGRVHTPQDDATRMNAGRLALEV
jgi:alkylation response protein AidB-like acyl-CoA dehydrogenase